MNLISKYKPNQTKPSGLEIKFYPILDHQKLSRYFISSIKSHRSNVFKCYFNDKNYESIIMFESLGQEAYAFWKRLLKEGLLL